MIGAGLRQQKRADAEPGACFSTSNGRAPQRGLTLFGHDTGNRKQNPLKPTAVVKEMLCSGADFRPLRKEILRANVR